MYPKCKVSESMSKKILAIGLILGASLNFGGPARAFTASFSWSGIAACGSLSPAFIIRNAPKLAAQLRFEMRDRDAPGFHHGGGLVASAGSVPQGAIRYVGPCPPAGQTHRYVWTIGALDAGGSVIARATTEGRFPPK